MLRLALVGLIASVLVLALDVQVPLGSSHRWQDQQNSNIPSDDYLPQWSLDKFPNPNTTDHLVFETVHSLLQHWPNTRMRNGHNIVPGIIPKGTLLYHGTNRRELPLGPEWVSMDPEHSYFFCREAHPQQGCWHLALTVTRPLRIVYFDGSSAAKLPYGSMDTQDLIAWGSSPPGSEWNEEQRIEDLCKWGKNFGVDGIVRMEVDFEVMLCNFTSGVNVTFANLAHPGGNPSPTSGLLAFQVMTAGSWHNRFPGETRIQLDLTGFVSLYDTQLVPSLVAVRSGQERWDHRVQNTSSEDLSVLKSKLEAALIKSSGPSSGIDWKTLIQVIVDRFAGRLELTRHLLNSSSTATNPNELFDIANKTQTQLRIMLTPYILFSAMPVDPSDEVDLEWTIPIFKLCATTHTYTMESKFDSMTDPERLLLKAVRGTTREICRIVTKMWSAGVYAGVDPSLNTKESLDITEVTRILRNWAEDLNRLMAWLDWSVWVKCNPACVPEETCYLPMWPIGFPGFPRRRGHLPHPPQDVDGPHQIMPSFNLREMAIDRFVDNAWNIIKPEPNEWIRPHPKCIRRVDTFEF